MARSEGKADRASWHDAIPILGNGENNGDVEREGGGSGGGSEGGNGDDFTFDIPTGERKKRGTGSGPRKYTRKARASQLDIDGLAALLFSLHYGVFSNRMPQMVLSPAESKELATGMANLARHWPDLPIRPYMIDAAFLAGTVAKIYVPRLLPQSEIFTATVVDEDATNSAAE